MSTRDLTQQGPMIEFKVYGRTNRYGVAVIDSDNDLAVAGVRVLDRQTRTRLGKRFSGPTDGDSEKDRTRAPSGGRR